MELTLEHKIDFITSRIELIYQEQYMTQKLLQVLIKKGEVHEIGGYAIGITSNNDTFVLLYPENDALKHKVCRVYSHSFHKLPDFISITITPRAEDDNPDRDKARARGVYHDCQAFLIATVPGKQTQMGAEKRFYLTLNENSQQVLPELKEAIIVQEEPEPASPTISEVAEASPNVEIVTPTPNEPEPEPTTYLAELNKDSRPAIPEYLSPSQQVIIEEMHQDGHLPEESETQSREEKLKQLNDDLFGNASVDDEPEPEPVKEIVLDRPYLYLNGTTVPASPFTEKLFKIYFDTLHTRPDHSDMLQEWYKSHVAWLDQEHNLNWQTFLKERDNA